VLPYWQMAGSYSAAWPGLTLALTMKLWLFSDLHLDVNRRYPFGLLTPRPERDVVIVAGEKELLIRPQLRAGAEIV